MSTFNVSNHASNLPNYGGVNETIIVHETTIFAFHVGYPNSPNITVNLESPGADWIGGFSQAPGSHLTITSGGEFTADGPSTANGSTYIGTNVVSLGAP